MIMNQHRIALLVFLTLESLPCFSIVNAFITPLQHPHRLPPRTIPSSPSRLSAGFGGGGKSSKKKGKKNNKEAKLKPKQMWDRYLELKKDTKVRVAVRRNSEEEWLEVGAVKSKGDENTAAAVFRQRALIAEHSHRLFPLKISSKDTVEWGYSSSGDSNSWVAVDKSALEGDIPNDFEKTIGFQGEPDPRTGFYCFYNEGKLVTNGNEVPAASLKKDNF